MISLSDIQRDLESFSDPGTDFVVSDTPQRIVVAMTRLADDIEIIIEKSSARVEIRAGNSRQYKNIASLLADSQFANLRQLSLTLRRLAERRDTQLILRPTGTIRSPQGVSGEFSFPKFEQILAEKHHEKLKVVLIDGRAGVGKTSLIEYSSRNRLQNMQSSPLLHVISRGSKISVLNQLLAAALDAVRANFTFDQVPALIRHGLVQVAIDGFDELVDSDGYSDAWGALKDFLRDVGAGGTVLLAARDTFFDQQAFERQLESLSSFLSFWHVRIGPASAAAAREYLIESGWPESEMTQAPAQDVFRPGSYALRPFFLSVLARHDGEKTWIDVLRGQSLRAFLVDAFIDREARLITVKTDLSLERGGALLRQVFAEISLEMAALETYSVDISFIELVVDAVFSDVLQPSEIGRLRHKAGSIGFLEADERISRDSRQFPHTEILNYFLSCGIISEIDKVSVARVLRRATLEGDFLHVFCDVFAELSLDVALHFVEAVRREYLSLRGDSDRSESNILALYAATLHRLDVHNQLVKMENCYVSDLVLVDRLCPAQFSRMSVGRLDVRSCDLRAVHFDRVTAGVIILDDDTLFGDTVPSSLHIQSEVDGKIVDTRGPDATKMIRERQEKADQEVTKNEASEILLRVLYVHLKRFAIRDSDEDTAGRLLQSDIWRHIELILEREGRLVRTNRRDVAGPNDDFVRVRDPLGLLRRADDAAERVWAQVEAL